MVLAADRLHVLVEADLGEQAAVARPLELVLLPRRERALVAPGRGQLEVQQLERGLEIRRAGRAADGLGQLADATR